MTGDATVSPLTTHCPWTQGLFVWQALLVWEQPVGP